MSKNNLLKVAKKSFSFNNSPFLPSVLGAHNHNNLRVISTPEFPVPYYQRIFRHLDSPSQMSIDMRKLNNEVDENVVINARDELTKTSEGLKVLEFVENKVNIDSYHTKIDSIAVQAEIYANDLLEYLDAAHEENHRIIKQIDLGECLKL